MNMRGFRIKIWLCFSLFLFSVGNTKVCSLTDEDVNLATPTILNGIELCVKLESTSKHENLAIVSEIINHSRKALSFGRSGRTRGFAFRLFDRNGAEIQPEVAFRDITPDAIRLFEGSTVQEQIEPGAGLKFTLYLNEAYGIKIKDAMNLVIEWFPGIDGSGNPHSAGRGLKAEIDLAKNVDGSAEKAQLDPAPNTFTPNQGDQPLRPNGEAEPKHRTPASSMRLNIIVVLILAATGLLWLLVKKRK